MYAGPVVRVSVYRLFHVEDDAVSALSELTEISEPRVATNNEHSDEESEAESKFYSTHTSSSDARSSQIPLAEIHRLKERNSSR